MWVWRNIVTRSRNHCCSGNTTVLSVCCWAICHCQLYKNIDCCTTMGLWQSYVTCNNKTYVGLNVKCLMLQCNKRMFVWSRRSLDVQFGWTNRNDRQLVVQFLGFCVAVKRFRWDGINYTAISINIFWMCVCILNLSCTILCFLFGCNIFFRIISQKMQFSQKKFLNKNVFWFPQQLFVWNISHSKKNSALCYHKCTEVFM